MRYYIIITAQIKFIFLCFRCYIDNVLLNQEVGKSILDKCLLLCLQLSEKISSRAVTMHHNVREKFVRVMR